ncbi:hypothetical protein [Vibrio owensii]|uniref:hypothetical protein n=1 Tax=Vibrio harveyi group TaxID=717610 RepID=UPI003CC5052F
MFQTGQLDLLIEVAEIYRIPATIKRAMHLHLVEGRSKEEAVHRSGSGCVESYEDWLSGLRETYTMAVKFKYPKLLVKNSLTSEQFELISEHVHLPRTTSDKIKRVLVMGESFNIKRDQNARMGLEMLQELVNDINRFRNSVKKDQFHQPYMVA